MANPTLTFNDGTASTLTAQRMRLFNWTPDVDDIAARRAGLGTGTTYQEIYRTDYLASFTMPGIQPSELSTTMRLKRHLSSGGTMIVATNDTSGTTYNVKMRPDTLPTIRLDNPRTMEYALDVVVINTSAVPLVALY
jgi:hypothetical protein